MSTCTACAKPLSAGDPTYDDGEFSFAIHGKCAIYLLQRLVKAFEDYQLPEKRREALRDYAVIANVVGAAK